MDYIFYKLEGHDDLIPYNIWGDTFDTPFYSKMSYTLIQTIRFMAEEGIKDLTADGVHILEVERSTQDYSKAE